MDYFYSLYVYCNDTRNLCKDEIEFILQHNGLSLSDNNVKKVNKEKRDICYFHPVKHTSAYMTITSNDTYGDQIIEKLIKGKKVCLKFNEINKKFVIQMDKRHYKKLIDIYIPDSSYYDNYVNVLGQLYTLYLSD